MDQFKDIHSTEIPNIKTLGAERIAALSGELSSSVGRMIGNRDNIASPVMVEKLAQLTRIIGTEGSKIIFMRHGEQSPPEWISSIADPAIRKISMMQNPLNKQDCLTNKGFVDVFATAFSLSYLQKVTGKNLSILSSENRRAEEVAEIISYIIPDADFSMERGLDSISYKDENDDPPVKMEQLLTYLPSGSMPWNTELIDKLCKKVNNRLKPSETIIKTVADLIRKGATRDGNNLIIALTHSQQLAEVLRVAGVLGDPSFRFPELTMIVMNKPDGLQIFPRGVLS